MMNQREVLNTLMMSESFAALSASVSMAEQINDKSELESVLALSAVEVLKHMDLDNIGFRTQEAEMHFVALMAVVFSLLFDGTDNFAAVTDHGTPVSIN